jgi:hypothetical protein
MTLSPHDVTPIVSVANISGDNSAVTQAFSGVDCLRENSLLYLLLMLGTTWLGLSLYNFTKT